MIYVSCLLAGFAGFLLGRYFCRERITHHTHLVFPQAKDPIVIDVDRARLRTE